MSRANDAQHEAAIWDCHDTTLNGNDANVFVHPDTGLRVAAIYLPNTELWSIEVFPPESAGDSPLYRTAFEQSAEAAKQAALKEIQVCSDGAPRTFDSETGDWRCA